MDWLEKLKGFELRDISENNSIGMVKWHLDIDEDEAHLSLLINALGEETMEEEQEIAAIITLEIDDKDKNVIWYNISRDYFANPHESAGILELGISIEYLKEIVIQFGKLDKFLSEYKLLDINER